MKTPEEIAQWVINNRYSSNEKTKVTDVEMYHTIVDEIEKQIDSKLGEEVDREFLDKVYSEIFRKEDELTDKELIEVGKMALEIFK